MRYREDVARQYSADEMEAIVRRALERQGSEDGFTHEDLMAAASQVGLPAHEVETAAAEVAWERDRMRWEDRARGRRRRRFWGRLGTFVGLNGVLFAVDALTGAGWWVHWVVMGTGIPMSIQGLRLFRPVEDKEVERERRREEREERRRERALRRRRRPRSTAEDFEVVVERGVDMLLDALDHRRRDRSRSDARPAPPSPGGPRVRVEPDADASAGAGETDASRSSRRSTGRE